MAEMGPMTQLNVRIPTRLKEQGGAALESVGLSPSAAVRALWEKAAKRGKDLDEVEQLLVGEPERPAAPQEDEVVARGHALWSTYLTGEGSSFAAEESGGGSIHA